MRLPRSLALLALLAASVPAFGRLAAAEGRSESGWPAELQAGPFVCRADFELAEHAELWPELAQLERDLIAGLGVPQAREPIYLYLFRDKRTHQRYMQQFFPRTPYRRALYVKGRGPGMVFAYRSSELAVDLRHESTHALLHAALPMIPLWLDEGLAEYFELAPDERLDGAGRLAGQQWRLRLGFFPRLEDLEALSDASEMGADEYRQAWAWAHFLLHGPEPARRELVSYFADVAAHTPPGELSRRLRRVLPDLEESFRQHFLNWR